METTHRPAAEMPCRCGFDAWFFSIQLPAATMPLDVSLDMDQPYEIDPDSTIPSTYIPPTATLDESILASTGDSSVPNKQPTVSMPVTDSPVFLNLLPRQRFLMLLMFMTLW